MKKRRFSESQVVAILKEADAGMKVAEFCRKPLPVSNMQNRSNLGHATEHWVYNKKWGLVVS